MAKISAAALKAFAKASPAPLSSEVELPAEVGGSITVNGIALATVRQDVQREYDKLTSPDQEKRTWPVGEPGDPGCYQFRPSDIELWGIVHLERCTDPQLSFLEWVNVAANYTLLFRQLSAEALINSRMMPRQAFTQGKAEEVTPSGIDAAVNGVEERLADPNAVTGYCGEVSSDATSTAIPTNTSSAVPV